MSSYKKIAPRITIKVLDSDNEELFEIPGRTVVDIGEIFSDHHIDAIIKKAYGNKPLPKSITVMAHNTFELE